MVLKHIAFFGANLELLVDDKARVPPVLEQLFQYLQEQKADCPGLFQGMDSHYFTETSQLVKKEYKKDGIYKARIDAMKKLMKRLENHTEIDHELEMVQDVHVVSGLLKLFFYRLQEPLLTFVLFEKFIRAQEEDVTCRVVMMRSLIYGLSDARKSVLYRLIQFFRYILQSKFATNGLNASKLAAVFGPIILKHNQEASEFTDVSCHVHLINGVTQTLIEQFQAIFETSNPAEFISLIDANHDLTHQVNALLVRQHELEQQLVSERKAKHRAIITQSLKNKSMRYFNAWRWSVYQSQRYTNLQISPKRSILEHDFESLPRQNIISGDPSNISKLKVMDHMLCTKGSIDSRIKFSYHN